LFDLFEDFGLLTGVVFDLGEAIFGLLPGDLALTGVDFGDLFPGVDFDEDVGDFFPGVDFEDVGDFVFGVDLGDFTLGVVFGDFLLFGDTAPFSGVDFLGLSSAIVDSNLKAARDFLFRRDFGDATLIGSDNLLGAVPLLTGVIGGSFLSNISGLSVGPNDILFFLALGAALSVDFLFLPLFFLLDPTKQIDTDSRFS
jgi:hypothetical protein